MIWFGGRRVCRTWRGVRHSPKAKDEKSFSESKKRKVRCVYSLNSRFREQEIAYIQEDEFTRSLGEQSVVRQAAQEGSVGRIVAGEPLIESGC